MHILHCLVFCLLWPLVLPKPAKLTVTPNDVMIAIILIIASMVVTSYFESAHVTLFYILLFSSLYIFQGMQYYVKIVTEGLTKEEWGRISNRTSI